MSNRTIRRAAERQAAKAVAKLQKLQQQTTDQAIAVTQPEAEPQAMSAAAGATTSPSAPTQGFT